jgi:hypothetical protein
MTLLLKVHSDDIVIHKTQALLGRRYNKFEDLENQNENDEDLTEILDGSAGQMRELKAYMVREARNYRDFEAFVTSLDNIETANSLYTLMDE